MGGDNTLQFIKLKKKTKKETSLCAILQKQEQKRNPRPQHPGAKQGKGLAGALQPPTPEPPSAPASCWGQAAASPP